MAHANERANSHECQCCTQSGYTQAGGAQKDTQAAFDACLHIQLSLLAVARVDEA